jgi:hypothetical protein
MDVFFSTKKNSLLFISQKEASKMRRKLIILGAEKRGKDLDGIELPEIDTQFALDNIMLIDGHTPVDRSMLCFVIVYLLFMSCLC